MALDLAQRWTKLLAEPLHLPVVEGSLSTHERDWVEALSLRRFAAPSSTGAKITAARKGAKCG